MQEHKSAGKGLAAGSIGVTLTGLEFAGNYANSAATSVDFPATDLDAMYGDLLFRNENGATVNVTISGLAAGTYQITAHHLINTPTPGDLDLHVQDADSAAFTQFVGNFTQGAGTTSAFNPNAITFNVVSNGTDDIILRMSQGVANGGGTTGGWFGFKGMEITICEPSSITMLGLGMLALLLRRR